MAQLVRDLMTADPVMLPPDTPVREAAKAMRDREIGDVLVVDGDRLCGIVTDRDLVVRALADRDDLADCYVRDVCSDQVVTARTTVCAEGGDSGGSLFAGNTALGLTSGGSGNCSSGGTTFFQPVVEALNAYGVRVY